MQVLYLDTPSLTYTEASIKLEISIDSIRDREFGVILKFRNAFPEFSHLEPYKHYTKHQQRFYIYKGLVHLPSMEITHPCYRIKTVNGADSRELISAQHDGFGLAELVKRNTLSEIEKTEAAAETV